MDQKNEEKYKESVTSVVAPQVDFYDPSKESIWTRLGVSFESFKRAPGTTGGQVIQGEHNIENLDKMRAENPMLQQKMKPRHLQMIAVGGSIGTGLFVGSGAALHNGGPLGILIAWLLMGFMLINVIQALGEMCILYPVSGGFYTITSRFLDPSFAFAMGWNYVFQWCVVLPLEITIAGTTVQYWTDKVPIAAWISIFWVLIVIISVFGTLGFAEEEFWSSCLKLLVVVMFIFIGIICIFGGGPKDGMYGSFVGDRIWHEKGQLAHGFKGLCSVFVTVSVAGTELVGLAASETPNPRMSMPAAVKGTFWRIILIYVTSLTVIGLLVSWDDPRLLGGGGAAASPFVIALDNAKIYGLNHFVNATICVSVLSIGLSAVYAGSRTLTALAETGYAPKIFAYVDKSSRPLWSVLVVLSFAPLAYVNVVATGYTIFTWLLASSGFSALVAWFAICLCHVRFRKAWKLQGHSLEELPFQAMLGVWGSYFGMVLVSAVLIAQFYIALWPIGGMSSNPKKVAEVFFSSYLAAPVMIFFYIVGFIWKRGLPKKIADIDLDTGRKSWLSVDEMRAWRAERKLAPLYIRIFRMLFTAS
ncbi:APC amino acid permease [Collybia nuda]|uniref:APC amino acid permease n=1 Tax=Collybia nuda TaxID=64659 RepID=A0A9P5XRA4_9AGAR|nr:APC amino acid permease [Collybia nuda]